MGYPILRVKVGKIKENGQIILRECAKHGISLWGVSKGISAYPEVAMAYKEAGFQVIADSRILNIKEMKASGIKSEFALIRIPMPSELEDVIDFCDHSLVSDIDTINNMSQICERKSKKHKIIIMFDMGDLREGFLNTQIEEIANCIKSTSPLLEIEGVGANFSCASGVLPSYSNLMELASYKERLEDLAGIKISLVSGGGTCSLVQMLRGNVPSVINHLRMGEALLLGTDTSFGEDIKILNQNTMTIEAELAELRLKPTLPKGDIGHDAFGNVPKFEDRGNRHRGILCIGKQDVRIEGLTPIDSDVKIITSSSDHLLVDLEDCSGRYKVGDILTFRPDYTAMLSSSTSKYVTKIFE